MHDYICMYGEGHLGAANDLDDSLLHGGELFLGEGLGGDDRHLHGTLGGVDHLWQIIGNLLNFPIFKDMFSYLIIRERIQILQFLAKYI